MELIEALFDIAMCESRDVLFSDYIEACLLNRDVDEKKIRLYLRVLQTYYCRNTDWSNSEDYDPNHLSEHIAASACLKVDSVNDIVNALFSIFSAPDLDSTIGIMFEISGEHKEEAILTHCDDEVGTVLIPRYLSSDDRLVSVSTIGYDAFKLCFSLKSVIIPDSVTYIGEGAFSYCRSLESVIIPDSVTYIGEGAFSYCTSLHSVTIPDSVTSIGKNAFHWCKSLQSVIIPNSVTSIGKDAFSGCESLQSITIPDSVESISDGVFQNCSSIQSVTIPDSVTSIGKNAFHWCKSLLSVVIPNSVTCIDEDAFAGC